MTEVQINPAMLFLREILAMQLYMHDPNAGMQAMVGANRELQRVKYTWHTVDDGVRQHFRGVAERLIHQEVARIQRHAEGNGEEGKQQGGQ